MSRCNRDLASIQHSIADSEEAVDAWKKEDFESLVRHNVAGIRRTRALMRLAERYCSKSDFSMKSLDPVA